MDVCSSLSSPPCSHHYQPKTCHFQALNPISFKLRNNVTQIRRQLKGIKVKALTTDVSATSADPQVTWQIIIGALAGVMPFVVAGIEFSKRIVAQRRCEVCGGSGLVLRDKKYYFRCPNCGGFLPWQSWKRFFSG